MPVDAHFDETTRKSKRQIHNVEVPALRRMQDKYAQRKSELDQKLRS